MAILYANLYCACDYNFYMSRFVCLWPGSAISSFHIEESSRCAPMSSADRHTRQCSNNHVMLCGPGAHPFHGPLEKLYKSKNNFV